MRSVHKTILAAWTPHTQVDTHHVTYNHNTTTQYTTDTTRTRTSFPPSVMFIVIHDKLLIAFGDDSGERAPETVATSKGGSRRANCAVLTQGGSDKK